MKLAETGGRLVFVEDYDMNFARDLVQGVDVWLNTPRRPNEACGTSGQKAALNGALNLSVLDGWWREGYNGENGWAIGGDYDSTDDAADAEAVVLAAGERRSSRSTTSNVPTTTSRANGSAASGNRSAPWRRASVCGVCCASTSSACTTRPRRRSGPMPDLLQLPPVAMALAIFLLRVCDMALDTLRVLFIVRGHRPVVWFLGFFQSAIWVAGLHQRTGPPRATRWPGSATPPVSAPATSSAWPSKTNWPSAIAICGSSARYTVPTVAGAVRQAGYGVTELDGHGRDGPVAR